MASCPAEFAGEGAAEMLLAADLARRGLAPMAGGMLDQAAAFVEACRFVWADEARHRAELRLPTEDD